MNSGDAFLVLNTQGSYLWLGAGANDEEHKLGTKLIETLGGGSENRVVIKEGEETEEFWEALGGKAEY